MKALNIINSNFVLATREPKTAIITESLVSKTRTPLTLDLGDDQIPAVADEPIAPKQFCGSIFPPSPLPEPFVRAVQALERVVGDPVWLIVQGGGDQGRQCPPLHSIDEHLLDGFLNSRTELPTKPVNIVIDSLGGSAKVAYQLSKLFRSRCGGYDVLVPKSAKSAATLFAVGASNLYLPEHAEL